MDHEIRGQATKNLILITLTYFRLCIDRPIGAKLIGWRFDI